MPSGESISYISYSIFRTETLQAARSPIIAGNHYVERIARRQSIAVRRR
jgi:hypothetical protein